MTLRHFLADDDLTAAEQAAVLDLADALKADPFKISPLAGPRSVALLFDKPTLRTQTSFSAGVVELGGFPMIVDGRLAQIGEREPVADVARVLGRQCAAVVWRTFGQDRIEEMAAYAGVPVVNALTDRYHPCQALADLMTIREHRGRLAGLSLAYVGDGANNVAHSYLLAGALAGLHVRIGAPPEFSPDPDDRGPGRGRWRPRPAAACWSPSRRREAVAGADVVATDTWVSMGNETDGRDRSTPFAPYAVTSDLLAGAPRTRSCCTACPPTGVPRSPPTSSTGRARWSGTRPRTGGTCRRPCWPSSSTSRAGQPS